MKKSRKRALRYSREKLEAMESTLEGKKLRATIPWTLDGNEVFGLGVEKSLIGQTTGNGWTVVDAERKNDQEITLTVIKG